MRIATVRMRWLTARAKVLLRDLDGEPPGDKVQDVLNDLTASPLVPAGDGELHDDQAEGLALDAVAFDLAVAFAGSFASTSGYARNDFRVSLDDVLEGALGAGHVTSRPAARWAPERPEETAARPRGPTPERGW